MAKKKVAIVVDSAANLPEELIAQYDMHVVPLFVNWDGQSLLDGVDITPGAFYQRLAQSSTSPTTSQPSPGDFYEAFSKVAETADSIVGIFISEVLSGTLASAHGAVDMMGDYPIEIVDSRSASMGQGLIAMAAARAAADGQDYKAVAALARQIVPQMRVMFVVDTLEYLHRGGRIGGARRLIGSMLAIKPVLHLVDGAIEPLASVRTKKKAVQHMLNVVQEQMGGKKNVHVAVLHAAAANEAATLADALRGQLDVGDMVMGELSPVIGTHVGPGTLGVACYAL